MPELRSSICLARLRSRKLEDQQPAEPPIAKPVPPAPRKRIPLPAVRGRNAGGGRRGPPRPTIKGPDFVDLDAGLYFQDLPKAVSAPTLVSEAKNPAPNKVADYIQNEDKVAEGVASKGLRMDGESAEKPVGVEDESTTAPIPEREMFENLKTNKCNLLVGEV